MFPTLAYTSCFIFMLEQNSTWEMLFLVSTGDRQITYFSLSDVPSVPKGPLSISDITETSCMLRWKPSERDGGLPITKYIIESREARRSMWNQAGTVNAGTTQFSPKNLSIGNEYYFRVKAVNEEGESSPLESDEAVVPKKKIGKWTECKLILTLSQTSPGFYIPTI